VVVAGRLTAWIAGAFVGARATADPDLWGHLRFGLDLARLGRLTAADPYSFTQDRPWINHEWLSELLDALTYRLAGVPGLLLLKGAILATAFALLWSVVRRADERYRGFLLAAAIVGLGPVAMTIRPQLWTILGLAVLIHILSFPTRLRWLLVLFVVWANLHGGWIVGAGVAGLWVLGRALDTRRIAAHLPAAATVAAAIAATAINPYGWRLWAFLWSTVHMTREIAEWRPLWEIGEASFTWLWAMTVGVVLWSGFARWPKMTWATVFPVAGLGLNALLVARLSPLFSEVALLATAAAWLSPASPETPLPAAPPARDRDLKMRVIVDIFVAGAVSVTLLIGESRCLPFSGGTWAPDLVAAGAFDPPDVQGRLVLPFDWGQYAIWHWGPRLRVSIDGRRETVYSDATITLQNAALDGRADGLAYLGRLRPEFVWAPSATGAALRNWLTASGYRLDIDTGRSFVATRLDLPRLAGGTPKSSCFP
jgi:hypothetical protein